MADTDAGPMKYIKDAIAVLSFLGVIAGVYIKLSEQVVRLEQKVLVMDERFKDLKESNAKLIDKMATLQSTISLNTVR